ncbi:hypothetical protein BVX98_02015 [bacterium F11]|nr:hypothetical protein BVX98_02015 [bacterium F11]
MFPQCGEAYRHTHRLPPSHHKVMRAIELCRTEKLGGHLEKCDSCGYERPCYNSCRNRHCPKCQKLTKARWLEARESELLPVPYFHLVFTVPHELNPLALCNKKRIYDILFKSVSETLLEFGKNNLGGTLGITAILHTWDQTMREHIHLHCAIPAGALSSDGKRWIPAKDNFLFSVKALSVVFRGKFLASLREVHEKGKLIFPGRTVSLSTKEGWTSLMNVLYQKEWVVYSKQAFRGPQSVLDYIGRYTHRIAISNERLMSIEAGQVTFSYRDRKEENKKKVMTLNADEFIRRFLMHVVPPSYMRIRHFGFLANRRKKKDLPRCRELLGFPANPQKPEKKSPEDLYREVTGEDLAHCPSCGEGSMRIIADIPKGRFDTS